MTIKEFVKFMVAAVVDIPDEIRVYVEPGDISDTYKVHVAPSDIGKAIGKQGRIANAMRVMLKAMAMKEDRKVFLEIVGRPAECAENPG